jgi:hypothetical protein
LVKPLVCAISNSIEFTVRAVLRSSRRLWVPLSSHIVSVDLLVPLQHRRFLVAKFDKAHRSPLSAASAGSPAGTPRELRHTAQLLKRRAAAPGVSQRPIR